MKPSQNRWRNALPMTSASAAKRLFAARQRFKRANTIWAKGFTLIEVVIVAAIAGVLGATAIPQFLGTKDRAEQRAVVAESVGLAKECATAFVENVSQLITDPGATTVNCGDTTADVDILSSSFASGNVDCSDTLVSVTSQVSLLITTGGVISCGDAPGGAS